MFKNHKRLQDVTNTREDNALYEETRVLKLHRINEEHTEYLLISTVSSGVGEEYKKKMWCIKILNHIAYLQSPPAPVGPSYALLNLH